MRISDWSSDVCSSDLHRSSPHDSFKQTMERYRDIHPDITPHVVADSAWGSVILLEWATEHGVRVTFSMSTKVWGWLPQSLAFGTPLESGRIAYIPELKSLDRKSVV